MSNLTRDQILGRKLGRSTATLPDGSTVAIRALTRNEALEMQALATTRERDNYVIAHGMTQPVLSIEDVDTWADEADAGDLVAVSEAIAILSGLKEGAGKSGVPRTGE